MVNKIDGFGIGTDSYSNKGPDKSSKTMKQSIKAQEESTQITNDSYYKLEISQIASANIQRDSKDYQDMKAKIEELKAKISNGTYEVDTGKIVQGLLKYFS